MSDSPISVFRSFADSFPLSFGPRLHPCGGYGLLSRESAARMHFQGTGGQLRRSLCRESGTVSAATPPPGGGKPIRTAARSSGRRHDHPVRTAVRSAVQIRPTRPARPNRTCGCCRAHPFHRPSSRPCGGRRECSAPSARFIVRQRVRRRSGIRCRPAARTASASERRIRDPPRRRIRGSPCSYRTSLSEYRPVFRCNSKK